MRRDLVQNLMLSAGTILVLLIGAESIARLVGFRWSATPLLGPATCTDRSPELGIVLRPSCHGELAGTTFTTNAAGLRGPELREDRSRRILAIGDSCTWGYRVADAESYPAVLNARLDALQPGRYQVLNAGVPGHTSYQGLVYLRGHGLRWRPAIVIAGYGFNDMAPSGDLAVQLRRIRRLGRVADVDNWFLVHSRVYQWTRFVTYPVNGRGQAPRVSLQRYEQNLRKIVALSRAHGAMPVLLSFWIGKPVPYATVPERVARALDVPLVHFDGPHMDIVHPSREGYVRLADDLVAALTARSAFVAR